MANKIKEFLDKKGMTQMDLCEEVRRLSNGAVKLAPNQVSYYISGKAAPNGQTMLFICKALKEPVEKVFVAEKATAKG